MIRPIVLACASLAVAVAPSAFADNWAQWRGPHFNNHSDEKNLPIEFGAPIKIVEKEIDGKKKKVADGFASPPKNIVWEFKMPGRGSSTPCVWGDRIFVTAQTKDDVRILCVGTDGKERWQKPIGTPKFYGQYDADHATASCLTDGKLVWAFAGSGKLACFDFEGKELWDADLQKYTEKTGKFRIQFGAHWTPVLYKGKLYLQVMHQDAQKLVKLDASTGKEEWAVERPGNGKPGASRIESPDVYTSPVIWEGEGGPLLVSHGNDFCTGHKLDDGAEVWRVMGLNPGGSGQWRFVSNVMVSPDLIVVPSCKNGPTVGFNPVGAKGEITPENKAERWRFKDTPDVVAPLRVDDVIYLLRDGPIIAIDAKTGTEIYRKNVTQQTHRSNMLYADGKIYCVGREGTIDVVQAGREFKILATSTLPDYILASPAVSNGRIYIRGWDTLWAIGTK